MKSTPSRPAAASAPSVAPSPGQAPYNDQSDEARRARAEAHNQSATTGLAAGGYAGNAGYAGGNAGTGTAARPQAPAYGGSDTAVSEAVRPSVRSSATPVEADAATPRVARLTIASIDPWSALKLSFLLAVAAVIALVVGVAVLWLVLDSIGVFDQLNKVLGNVGMTSDKTEFDIYKYVGFGKVLSIAIVIGVINAALLTALATVTTLLYNLSAGLVGGVRVTLSDD